MLETSRERVRAQTTDQDRPLLFSYAAITRFVPLIVFGGFFLTTIALVAVGPINWNIDRPVRLYGFVCLAALALFAGYWWSTRGSSTVDPDQMPSGRHTWSASTLVVVGSLVYLALYLPTVHTTTGRWYPDVWGGLSDASTAYARNKYYNEHGSQIALYVRMLAAPFTLVVLPTTLYLYPRLSRLAKVLGILTIVLGVVLSISQGVNRGVTETCSSIILFLVLVGVAALTRRDFRRVAQSVVAAILVVGLFAAYYSVTISDRVAADAVTDTKKGEKVEKTDEKLREMSTGFGGAEERKDSPFYVLTPKPLQSIGIAFDSYVTQGYRGLDLSMGHAWEPTYGLGFSEFVRHNVLRVIGQSDQEDEVLARTYAGKVSEDGWPVGQFWGTFFMHPASDISYPGTLVLMLFIGLAFGLSWRDALTRGDPLATTIFYYLCILVMYLPANNQLYQGGELAIGFSVLLAVWLWTRRTPREPHVRRS